MEGIYTKFIHHEGNLHLFISMKEIHTIFYHCEGDLQHNTMRLFDYIDYHDKISPYLTPWDNYTIFMTMIKLTLFFIQEGNIHLFITMKQINNYISPWEKLTSYSTTANDIYTILTPKFTAMKYIYAKF